jgi:hypothetical protein
MYVFLFCSLPEIVVMVDYVSVGIVTRHLAQHRREAEQESGAWQTSTMRPRVRESS